MRRLLLLILFPVALLSQTTAPAGGSVEGRVTNAQTGDGIAGATLRLSPAGVRAGAAAVHTATSQPDGSFRFDGVEPGTYLAVAVQAGFSRSDGTQASPVISVGAGQQVTGVSVQLNPQGSISGKLVDADGNPVSGRVEAFMAYVSRGKTKLRPSSSADAGESGDFVLTNITAGKYFLLGEPDDAPPASKPEESRLDLVRTFYPKALDFETATPIEITAGQNVPGTDIHLQRAATYHVRGKVERLPGTASLKTTLSLMPGGEQTALAQTQSLKADGTFDFEKVLPGSYVLQLTALDSAGLAGIFARQEIQVSAADLDGVLLSFIPPLTITGRVTLEGVDNANLSQVHVTITSTENPQLGFYTNLGVNADGTFRIEDLDPGEYTVRVASGPSGTYVKSISFNRQDITTGVMDVSQGGSVELDVVLRMGAAEVDGTVQTGDSGEAAPSPRLTIVLVPGNMAPDGSGILFGSTSPGGNFSIRNVPPGRYYAFAIEKWNTIWQNPDFLREMQSRGTTIDVQERAHLQIQLRTVASDDIRETAARLGLTLQ